MSLYKVADFKAEADDINSIAERITGKLNKLGPNARFDRSLLYSSEGFKDADELKRVQEEINYLDSLKPAPKQPIKPIRPLTAQEKNQIKKYADNVYKIKGGSQMLFKTAKYSKVTRSVDMGQAMPFTAPAAFAGNLMASSQNGTSSMTRALLSTLVGAGLGPLVGLGAMNLGGGVGGAQLASLGAGLSLAYAARKILDKKYEPVEEEQERTITIE